MGKKKEPMIFKDLQDASGFLDHLEKIKKVGSSTIRNYICYYRFLDPKDITTQSIKKFVRTHGNSFSIRGMLKNYLEYRELHRIVDLPPAPSGSSTQRQYREISQKEIRMFSQCLHGESFRYGLMFDLIYQGALRRFEIPTITLSNFQWRQWIENNQEGFLRLIIKGKRKKERIVLINKETGNMIIENIISKNPHWESDMLMEFLETEHPLFADFTEAMIYHTIKRRSMKYLKKDIRPHELRHCRATELKRLGVPIYDIKNYLGHSKLSTTEIYLHLSESESLNTIENILRK